MPSSSSIAPANQIRTCSLDFDRWYAIAPSSLVKDKPVSMTFWQRSLVLYRDKIGVIRALKDCCPHRQVKLSSGEVIGNEIECPYHGWRFDFNGNCSSVPYLSADRKLPKCQIDSYPVLELNGFIWLFPGDRTLSESILPLGVPEWDDLNYIATVSVIECQGHYSYLIENLMDMYHGHLHKDYQAWTAAKLQDIFAEGDRVAAVYEAQSYYKIDKIWSISQLFFPSLRRLHPEVLKVSYIYPHWVSSLGDDFKIYCLFCPVDETNTRAYLIHFTSLNAFKRLHKLPIWFRKFVKNSLFGAAQKMLDGLVKQDVEAIEQEQQAYLNNPQIRNCELNPVIFKVQRLILERSESGKKII